MRDATHPEFVVGSCSVTTFDLHIIRRMLSGFLFMTGALIVFFILLHYLEYVDDFLDSGGEEIMREIFTVYYPSYIPEIIRLTSPLALFLTCIYLTGKLAQELQLVALQTSGVSLYRLLRPYVVVGIFLTGFMFWFNGWVVPKTNAVVLEYDGKYLLNDAPRPIDLNDIHRQNQPGSIVYVGYYDRRTSTAYRVSMQQFSGDDRLVKRIDAPHMHWIDSLTTWRLSSAVVRRFADAGREDRYEVAQLDTVLHILPRDFARTERDVESMTITEAAQYVDALHRSGANNIGRTLVGYYTKYFYPLANLIVILLGVPLASVRRRGGQAVQIALGLFIAFAYLTLQKLTEPFGYFGDIPPFLTAWLPHAVFFTLSLVLLMRARK